jgi:integrase
MEKVIYKAVFNRKNKLLPNGNALIQIEAYLRGKKKYFTTNIYISPGQWDTKHRTIKDHPNQISLNKEIRNFMTMLEDAELKQIQNNKSFSLDYLSEIVKGNITDSFIDFCFKEVETAKIKDSTKRNHKATIKYLAEFKKTIRFEDINYEMLTQFEDFLIKKGVKNNTIVKHFTVTRRYVNLAIDKECLELNKYPFRKFKVKAFKTHREYLTPEELELFENVKLTGENSYLQLAQDKFLFSVYTGLRYSDIEELKPESLKIIDGKEWIILDMVKTGDSIRIPVYLLFDGKALDIFYKYVGNQNTLFPFHYNRFLNNEIRLVAGLAKINKRITFHAARHTQATYLLYKGVNITTVQKLLGHRRLETTQIYGKVMDMTVVNELKNISFSKVK